MNPHVTKGGRSFRGAWLYYMHDPQERTRERVVWAQPVNMLTDDPDLAWKVMAYTAKSQERLKEASGQARTGRKLEKPVLAYSLSWHPEQDPDKEHMLQAAQRSLSVLGLEEHEAIVIAHRDTPHRHVHVVANRVHPLTGKVASDSNTYRKLSDFALQYSREHGLTHSPQREANARKREEGKQARYRDPHIAEAWSRSDSGAAFVQALAEKGYHLARGNKRLVIVDPYGKTINPVRHLEGVKTRDFKDRLRDVDASSLRDATELAQEVAARHEQQKQHLAEKKSAPKLREEFKAKARKPAPVPDAKKDFTKAARKTSSDTAPGLRKAFRQEEARLLAEQRQKEANERARLRNFYRLDTQKQEIDNLSRRIEHAPWWRRLLGFTRRDREQLSDLQKSFDNARWRYKEQVSTLRTDFEQARQDLRRKYGQHEKTRDERINELRQLQQDRSRRSRDGPGRLQG